MGEVMDKISNALLIPLLPSVPEKRIGRSCSEANCISTLYIRDKVLLLIKNKKDISEFIKDKKDAIQPKRKIKETEYDKIKILYNEGCSVINIAKKYNVERTVIYKILKATI